MRAFLQHCRDLAPSSEYSGTVSPSTCRTYGRGACLSRCTAVLLGSSRNLDAFRCTAHAQECNRLESYRLDADARSGECIDLAIRILVIEFEHVVSADKAAAKFRITTPDDEAVYIAEDRKAKFATASSLLKALVATLGSGSVAVPSSGTPAATAAICAFGTDPTTAFLLQYDSGVDMNTCAACIIEATYE